MNEPVRWYIGMKILHRGMAMMMMMMVMMMMMMMMMFRLKLSLVSELLLEAGWPCCRKQHVFCDRFCLLAARDAWNATLQDLAKVTFPVRQRQQHDYAIRGRVPLTAKRGDSLVVDHPADVSPVAVVLGPCLATLAQWLEMGMKTLPVWIFNKGIFPTPRITKLESWINNVWQRSASNFIIEVNVLDHMMKNYNPSCHLKRALVYWCHQEAYLTFWLNVFLVNGKNYITHHEKHYQCKV